MRLAIWRSWFQIPSPYFGWLFFTLICGKKCIDVCFKSPKLNKKEAGDGSFKKIKVSNQINKLESCKKHGSYEEFVITKVQSHSPGHSAAYQCSEPSVIPLSYPVAPILVYFNINSHFF